jgi:hypothetical protein
VRDLRALHDPSDRDRGGAGAVAGDDADVLLDVWGGGAMKPSPVIPGQRLTAIQRYRRSEVVPLHDDLQAHGGDHAAAYEAQRQTEEQRVTVTVHWVRRDGSFQADCEGRRLEFDADGSCRSSRLAGSVRIDWKTAEEAARV